MRDSKNNTASRFGIYIFWALFAVSVSLRFWLAKNHFPHYDDLWGIYRAISIKGMGSEEFIGKLPAFLQGITTEIDKIDVVSWLLRHIASVKEATYKTTLAPLHYAFSLATTGTSGSYKGTLFAGRIVSVIEYILFVLMSTKYCNFL